MNAFNQVAQASSPASSRSVSLRGPRRYLLDSLRAAGRRPNSQARTPALQPPPDTSEQDALLLAILEEAFNGEL